MFLITIWILINLVITYELNYRLPGSTPPYPLYDVYKLLYTNLSKIQSSYLQKCIQRNSTEGSPKYQLIGSVNIYDGESTSYPAIVRYCQQYYTLNGHLIYQFSQNKHFISSIRNEATYFAEIGRQTEDFYIVTIRKLVSRNKKVMLEEEATINISKEYGEVTSFSNSFSLSLKLFAFATKSRYILFYRMEGRLESSIFIGYETSNQNWSKDLGILCITKLSLQLAIYSNISNSHSLLYTISTNGKNSTLKKYALPKLQQGMKDKRMEVKYRDQNWNQLYLRIGSIIYMYNLGKSQTHPKTSYKLLTADDEFFIANSMIIIQPKQSKQQQLTQFRMYYNLTSGTASNLLLPDSQCQQSSHIQSCSQSTSSQLLCTFCKYSFQCYSLSVASDPSVSSKLDYTDYSKLRVPLVLISLGVVIFISVTRSRKGKSLEEEKEEQVFMNQLQKRDKSLYEELKRNKILNKR